MAMFHLAAKRFNLGRRFLARQRRQRAGQHKRLAGKDPAVVVATAAFSLAGLMPSSRSLSLILSKIAGSISFFKISIKIL